MSVLCTGFLSGPNGSLHLSAFVPAGGVTDHWIIHAPAFAEEMNKSRHMVAQQARAFAGEGSVVIVPDLTGTGDSSGNLEDINWQMWLDDIAYVIKWAREQGARQLVVWGHRLGCLLAAELASSLAPAPEQLLLWQPVHSGKQHMTQFLRLRMAAGLGSGNSESVSSLRQRLLDSGTLEVAGYSLPAALFVELEQRDLSSLPAPPCAVQIFEVVTGSTQAVSHVTARLVEKWRASGLNCVAGSVQGSPFWMTQELGSAPMLVEESTACLVTMPATARLEQAGTKLSGRHLQGLSASSRDATRAMVFHCESAQLAGIMHMSPGESTVGVLIVVGGPQYRAGSHRQFVHLARYLASHGIPVLRFDYRGMGDSSGELKGFEHINLDIRSAIDALQRENSGIINVVIWGLCDAATASVLYAGGDSRVKGLIIANPWVYSEQGAAKAYLKHYYLKRVLQRAFWAKLSAGKFDLSSSVASALAMLKSAYRSQHRVSGPEIEPESVPSIGQDGSATSSNSTAPHKDLILRFTAGLSHFTGNVLFLLSGDDLTAAEFNDAARHNSKLRRVLNQRKVSQVNLAGVDHTFSRKVWRAEVEASSLKFIKQISQ